MAAVPPDDDCPFVIVTEGPLLTTIVPLAEADPFAFATTFAIELASVAPLVEFTLEALTIAYAGRDGLVEPVIG